MKEVQR